jgi:hypothetical protein
MDTQQRTRIPVRPKLLDVIRIDSRWAQVIGGGRHIKYLENQTIEEIDWRNYKMTRRFNCSVGLLEAVHGITPSPLEIVNVHWGSEQEEHPELKEDVSAFGEYERI